MSRDKKITARQTVKLVQSAYDRLEGLAKQTLVEEFGFSAEQMQRFDERFAELSAQECMRIEARLRR